MSGHSKWSTIKRDKASNDAKRSQIFTKISRMISVAAKKGGGDPASNPSLRLVVEKAKEARMPRENIERAIEKAVGGSEGSGLEEVTCEGYGPEGVAVVVKALTSNKNRTVSEIRGVFHKHGGSLGESGCALYIFEKDPENPMYEVPVSNPGSITAMLEELDNLDDVSEVYSNFVSPS